MDPASKTHVAINVNANNNGNDHAKGAEQKRVISGSSCEQNMVKESGSCVSEVVNLVKVERDCRICHLNLDSGNQEFGLGIELGCSCKDDFAFAHKVCAEAWFEIKGNKTCEICGSLARNIAGENEVELVDINDSATATTVAPPSVQNASESQNFLKSNRFLNFLLACMVFAFVISWLFHFNVPS